MRLRKMWMIIVGLLALCLVAAFGLFMVAQNVEQPKYEAVITEGAFEIRDYPALIAAQVVRKGDRWSAVRAGFGPLAGYIFAKERRGDKIAMTAPVTQRANDKSGSWTIQFIMPSGHTRESLPVPTAADVNLRDLPPQRRAAIRFSGVATDELIAENEAALREWLVQRGDTSIGAPLYAYYNDPFTPGFLRRNEVLLDLAK